MSDGRYPQGRTALLLVDPYNDFLSDGGKFWPMAPADLPANWDTTSRWSPMRPPPSARRHAAHALNGPTFAHAIVTTAQLVAALAAEETVS